MEPTMLRKRFAVVLLLTLLAACASIDPRRVMLSAAEVQTLVERQFPRQQRVMELLDVTLVNPVVKLVPERNRLATTMDLLASERLSGRSLRGSLSIDHSLRFESSDASVRLANVKVEDLKLELAGSPLTGQAARLGALLAERALNDFVIYRVSEERRQTMARVGVNNADIAVTSRGIELRFIEAR
jgi:citrate lyase gamma subunit